VALGPGAQAGHLLVCSPLARSLGRQWLLLGQHMTTNVAATVGQPTIAASLRLCAERYTNLFANCYPLPFKTPHLRVRCTRALLLALHNGVFLHGLLQLLLHRRLLSLQQIQLALQLYHMLHLANWDKISMSPHVAHLLSAQIKAAV